MEEVKRITCGTGVDVVGVPNAFEEGIHQARRGDTLLELEAVLSIKTILQLSFRAL